MDKYLPLHFHKDSEQIPSGGIDVVVNHTKCEYLTINGKNNRETLDCLCNYLKLHSGCTWSHLDEICYYVHVDNPWLHGKATLQDQSRKATLQDQPMTYIQQHSRIFRSVSNLLKDYMIAYKFYENMLYYNESQIKLYSINTQQIPTHDKSLEPDTGQTKLMMDKLDVKSVSANKVNQDIIYVLKLVKDKYYIGRTGRAAAERYAEHLAGTGSKWTSLHKPLKIVEVVENIDPFDEDKYTKMYMNKYGIENVRGGSYTSIILNEYQIYAIKVELDTANNRCFKCNQSGHYAINCNM